jgi:hypothetical protein
VAHSSEQRDTHPLCGARKKNGETCRAFAGQGTPHPGVGRCKFHGGSTATHVAGAAAQEAQARMLMLGAAVDIEPHEALLGVLRLSSGHVAWLRQEVSALDNLASTDGQILRRLYGEERDRVGRLAKACLDAGVAERQVRLAERYGEVLGQLFRAVFRFGRLTWPHFGRLIWPHPRPTACRAFELFGARAGGRRGDGIEGGAVRADQA